MCFQFHYFISLDLLYVACISLRMLNMPIYPNFFGMKQETHILFWALSYVITVEISNIQIQSGFVTHSGHCVVS